MKYFIIAGEASGDLHGSRLIARLLELDNKAVVQAWGGDLMSSAGADIKKHYRELAFMGFVEVILHIRTILKNFTICKSQIDAFKPDALIFIDYPGFNLRMTTWAKNQGYKTFYYISPQLWAWKEGRVKYIKSAVDKLYTILPFENAFYARHQVFPEYVGHPLLEIIKDFKPSEIVLSRLGGKKILALLPGSRKQEVSRMLPVYLSALSQMEDFTPVIAAAPSLPISYYEQIIKEVPSVITPILIQGQTYSILSIASLAWVSSGTATLETALFGVPQIVCYAGNKLSYLIARNLVKVKYISLVNLIIDKKVIEELIQDKFNVKNLVEHSRKLDSDKLKAEYKVLQKILLPDNASYRVAKSIIDQLVLS